jgi:hypothetical protein
LHCGREAARKGDADKTGPNNGDQAKPPFRRDDEGKAAPVQPAPRACQPDTEVIGNHNAHDDTPPPFAAQSISET